MAIRSLPLIMIVAILAFSSLFDVSIALGGRKALAPAPTSDNDVIIVGPAPIAAPGDLGFTLWDSKDQKVIDLATFAVDYYNKANNVKIVLSEVLEATSTTDDQETNYGLIIWGTKNKDSSIYYIKISVVNGVKKVTYFGNDF